MGGVYPRVALGRFEIFQFVVSWVGLVGSPLPEVLYFLRELY